MTHLAHFATERALAPVAPIPSLDTAAAILSVAEALQPDLAQGFQIDALRLRVEMERVFGGSDATGAWDWKLAYEAGEDSVPRRGVRAPTFGKARVLIRTPRRAA